MILPYLVGRLEWGPSGERSSDVADERIREEARKACVGDSNARHKHRREHLRAAPDDVALLLPDLELDAWNALQDDERREVAELLARVLEARSRPMDLIDVRWFGPEAEQPVARYRDRRSGFVFALVPGGQFEPGLSEEQIETLTTLSGVAPVLDPPRRLSGLVTVAPFLMGVAPMRLQGSRSSFPEHGYIYRSDLRASLAAVGVAMPDTQQLEWAARGGPEPQLFPWGDDLAFYESAVSSRSWAACEVATPVEASQDPAEWPLANRFGLLALGGAEVWCLAKPGFLATWSGAGMEWPWQVWGEWLLSVCGWARPHDGGNRFHEGAAVRPVIAIAGR